MRPIIKSNRCLAATVSAIGLFCCGFSPAISQTRQVTSQETDRVAVDLARQQELDQLRRSVGRYAAGQADVYIGEIELKQRGEGQNELQFPFGRVVAALIRSKADRNSTSSGATLTIVSPVRGLWLRISQSSTSPGATFSTLLRPLRSNAGTVGSCHNCFPDLLRRPERITLERFAAVGTLHDRFNSTFRIQLQGQLKRLPPGELRLEYLEVLEPGLESYLRDEAAGFTRSAGEGVRIVERNIRQRIKPPDGAPPQTRCERVTRYTAQRFVDLADLGRFGVRNITVLGSRICCLDHDSHGGAEECTREGAG
jgi:hypothetical protein